MPELIGWVKDRFGRTTQHGATSIREQDTCFLQMSSHTARYASVVAKWYGVTSSAKDHEEARASFALATYSACDKFSKPSLSINHTGIDYEDPWFSDSYFDYLSHYFDGMAEMPEMAPENEDHLIRSTSIITRIRYSRKRIEYAASAPDGDEILRITFRPAVYSNGRPLDRRYWKFGKFRRASNILRIHRIGVSRVVIKSRTPHHFFHQP